MSKVSKTGFAANNLFFLSMDMAESFRLITEQEMKVANVDWHRNVKPLVNQHKWVTKDLLKSVRQTDMSIQEDFGSDADNMIKLMVLIADRVGSDESKMQDIFNYVEQMPSVENLNLNKFNI
jgi:Asp-tRNA(Asn)/Glu-tRNA(Gln) amidotransferase B subunit